MLYCLLLLIFVSSVSGATLHGDIYDLNLDKVENVLVEIDTVPKQQQLAKTGEYSFEVPEGDYILEARYGELEAIEQITIVEEGEFVFDLFLFPSFEEEDDFLTELEVIEVEEEKKGFAKYPLWSYLIALGIFLIAIGRIFLARKKYGKLKEKREENDEGVENKAEGDESEEGKESFETEPSHLEEALEIIKKHEGRIYQKELRKEMIYLSEAKISLILTELEHKGKIEKIKKGRGNVIILKK